MIALETFCRLLCCGDRIPRGSSSPINFSRKPHRRGRKSDAPRKSCKGLSPRQGICKRRRAWQGIAQKILRRLFDSNSRIFHTGTLSASLNFADKIFRALEEFGKFLALNFLVGFHGLDGFNFFVKGGNNRLNILRHESVHAV